MIHISKENESETDFKDKFIDYSVIFLDFLEMKKNMREEIIEAITCDNYFLYKKKIYAFQNSYLIPKNLINLLFKLNGDKDDNKDIYLLNVGENEYHIKKKFQGKFRYYKPINPLDSYENTFFLDLLKVLTLDKNRSKLINYDKITPPLSYIIKMMSYNIAKDNSSLTKLNNNVDVIINLRKYYEVKGFNKNILYALINECFSPLFLRKLDFPKNKDKEVEEKFVEIISNEIKDISDLISEEFMDEFKKEEKKPTRTRISMF